LGVVSSFKCFVVYLKKKKFFKYTVAAFINNSFIHALIRIARGQISTILKSTS